MKSWILVLIFLLPVSLIARPPFNYDSAVRWADETTKSNVPKAQRIYIFGPKEITETYSLNNKPAKHDVSVRRIRLYREAMVLGGLLSDLRDEVSPKFVVLVYRRANPIEPVLRLTYTEAHKSKFPLQPLDVIDITKPTHGLIP